MNAGSEIVTLRPYQQIAIDDLRAAYGRGRRAPLFVLPTGGGKTVTFVDIAANARAKGLRSCIMVHRAELLRQISNAFWRIGVAHGLIAPDEPETDHPIQVASVQTLARRLQRYKKNRFDLIVIDEAHHANATTWRNILAFYPEAKILGVTATACRSDGAGLGDIFDEIVLGPSVKDLIAMGYLAPISYYAPDKVDLTGVRKSMGDYERNELERRVDRPAVTGSAVDYYLRLCGRKPAIVFCVGVRHAENVAGDFRKAGLRAESVDGTLDAGIRRARIEGIGNGTLDILTSVDLIGEGLDVPGIHAAILLRPTQSTGLFLQQVGRALRPSAGKNQAIILDHVGNVERHGHPAADREWSLDPKFKVRPRKETDPEDFAITQCPNCFFVYESAAECPNCGKVRPARVIKQTKGELKLIKEEQAKAKTRARIDEEMDCRTIDELADLGRRRGYGDPRVWAIRKWRFISWGRARRKKL